MFKDFNWSLLDSDSFKEDSVREELIVPLLQRLGYSASGNGQICRSVTLAHPFVKLGSKRHRIKIIPDYTLKVNNQTCWILEAKPPVEPTKGENAQQAFSYAIHPDVRVRYFAVCNGKWFTVYDVFRLEPILDFKLVAIDSHWQKLVALLSPDAFLGKPRSTLITTIETVRQITAIIDGAGELQFPISMSKVKDAVSILLATQKGRHPINLYLRDELTQVHAITLSRRNSAEILLSSNANLCHRRFALCDSLCSLVFPSKHNNPLDDIARSMNAVQAFTDGLSKDSVADVSLLRLLAAMELFIPWRLRGQIKEWQRAGKSPFEIATKLCVPMQLLQVFLKTYRQQSDAIHKKLDAQQGRPVGNILN